MTEKIIIIEDSTPLATVDDIQKRLLRPSSLHSPSLLNSTQLRVNLKENGTVKKKLEDYLDPVLLAAVSAKIGGSKKTKTGTKLKREDKGFEWPVDELKVFVEDDDSRNADRGSRKNREAVDLNSNFDVIGDGDVGDEEIRSPFQRFEKTALKKSKKDSSQVR
ncbi:hypothetical protein REPUB_Repub02eG0260400 [Reevesia pubescens]